MVTEEPIDDDRRAELRRTFDAVAQTYLEGAGRRWEPIGRRLVELVAPPPGGSVLDAACGAGAATLPAAEAVGPSGSVLGVDLAEEMLALNRRRAQELGFEHVQLRTGDFHAIDAPDGAMDAAVCSISVFFAPQPVEVVRELLRVVKRGGRIGLSVWHADAMEPLYSIFHDALATVRPQLEHEPFRYGGLGTEDALRDLLETAGGTDVRVVLDAAAMPIEGTDSGWKVIEGGGMRSALDGLDDDERAQVKADLRRRLEEAEVTAFDATVLYGIATKP